MLIRLITIIALVSMSIRFSWAVDTREIPAVLCMSGDEQPFGQSTFEGMQMAFDEANARSSNGPRLTIKVYDEKSTVEAAKQAARQIVDSGAPFVIGSVFSYLSLVEGPVFAQGNVAALADATSDLITRNPTTFRVLFKNSDEGELLANYAARVLHLSRLAVISSDDAYGNTLRSGFEPAADHLGLTATYTTFKTDEEAVQAARSVAADPTRPAVVLLMLDGPASRVLPILHRGGVTTPILGGDSLGDENLSARMAGQPEEKGRRGTLTDGLYGLTPIVLDSANADAVDFAARFHARYGHEPTWNATAGYDLGLLAIAVEQNGLSGDGLSGDSPEQRRAAVLAYLQSLKNPSAAIAGVLGPIWFDKDHGRLQGMRMARFDAGHLASAPLQILPVSSPDASEVASGAVFDMGSGHYARIQRVVYTGIYVNDIPRIDLAQSSFGADFYLWLRYAANAGPGASDPTDLIFPNMVSGGFDPSHPAEERAMPDGTTYRLWRVRAHFEMTMTCDCFRLTNSACG
jgi:branched-chain amino acid transport system substrate-binding protein